MLKTSFGKSAIGKLAIGVVALSGVTVAHADVLGSFKGFSVGAEGIVIPSGPREGWNPKFKSPMDAKTGGLVIDSSSKWSKHLGSSIRVGFTSHFGGLFGNHYNQVLRNDVDAANKKEKLDAEAANASLTIGSAESERKVPALQTFRESGKESGFLMQVGPRLTLQELNLFGDTNSFYGIAAATVGPVVRFTDFKSTHFVTSLRGGIGFNIPFLPRGCIGEVTAKHIMPLNRFILPSTGISLAVKYAI